MQISTMTNGSIAITKSLLQKAQLEGYVNLVMDITQPKAWKPSPAAYSYAVKQLNLEPQQVRLYQDSWSSVMGNAMPCKNLACP